MFMNHWISWIWLNLVNVCKIQSVKPFHLNNIKHNNRKQSVPMSVSLARFTMRPPWDIPLKISAQKWRQTGTLAMLVAGDNFHLIWSHGVTTKAPNAGFQYVQERREGWGGVQVISWCWLPCLLVHCFASRSCPAMSESPTQARSGTAPLSTLDRIGRSMISGRSKQFQPANSENIS